jgi:hypothetical protein
MEDWNNGMVGIQIGILEKRKIGFQVSDCFLPIFQYSNIPTFPGEYIIPYSFCGKGL